MKVPGRFQAAWARWVAWALDHLYWRTSTDGRGNVPRRGGAILAVNHTGLVDGPVVLGASPRGVHFLIKHELARGLGGRILLAAGQIPVDRRSGRTALRTALVVLRRGGIVGIFPEGARGSGAMNSARAGVAWLAARADVPVIPVACLGTRRQGEGVSKITPPLRRLHVSFGPAIALVLDPDADERTRTAAALEQIIPALRDHIERAQERTGLRLPGDSGRPDLGE